MNPIYLNEYDIAFLERIQPFPGIADKIYDIIANNNFKGNRYPYLDFKLISEQTLEASSEKRLKMPELEISVLDPMASLFDIVFEISINLWGCDLTCEGKSALYCLLNSRFAKYFINRGYARFCVELTMDVTIAAQFMTYYLYVFGYKDPSDFRIGMHMEFTSCDMSKMSIPHEIKVPDSLLRAVARLKDLKLSYSDYIFISMSGLSDKVTNELMSFYSYIDDDHDSVSLSFECVLKNRNEVERRLAYHNSDCLYLSIDGNEYYEYFYADNSEKNMRFITDYFLFLNPCVRIDEIVVSIDFSICRNYAAEKDMQKENENEDGSDWLFNFYPDGSEDSPEKLAHLLNELEKMRK